MKRIFGILLVSVLVLGLLVANVSAAEAIKLGKVDYAAHGTKAFAVAFVVMQGDTIVGAYLDEYQFLPSSDAVGVPNADVVENGGFASNFANPERVLASKRLNNEYYSNNMKKAGSTVPLADNYAAIEAFVVGKTIAELEAILAENTHEEMVDVITSATLVDTKGYVEALLEAAKNAQ